MERIRILAFSLFAAFALSAVASASASANDTCTGHPTGTEVTLCAENTLTKVTEELGSPNENKLVNDNHTVSTVLKGKVLGFTTELTGSKAEAEVGVRNSEEAAPGTITFTGVTVVKPAKCEANSPGKPAGTVVATFNATVKANATTYKGVFTGSGAENTFVEIEFKGAECALKGTKAPIKGKQTCELDTNKAEAEAFVEHHKLTCKFAGSELTLGGNKAEFETKTPFEEVEPKGAADSEFEKWQALLLK